MQAAIVTAQSANLKKHFDSEEELQDLMTKRMLEASMIDGDDDGLEEDDPNKYQTSAMVSHSAKAKTRQLKWMNE